MTTQRIRHLIALLACCSVLMACSSRPTAPDKSAAQRAPVRKIALVPAIDPEALTVENRGSALNFLALPGYLAQRKIADDRSQTLAAELKKHSLRMGDEFSADLQRELSRAGYEVVVLKDVKRSTKDPDDVDFESIKTDADAILNARFDTAGLFSGQFSTDFIPRLKLDIKLLAGKDHSDLYSQAIYYGADVRKPADDEIKGDPKYAYGSFNTAIEKSDEVAECLRQGMRQIAARVAKHLRDGGI